MPYGEYICTRFHLKFQRKKLYREVQGAVTVLLNPPPTTNVFIEPVSIRKNEGPMP
jgi:hypothetical protein